MKNHCPQFRAGFIAVVLGSLLAFAATARAADEVRYKSKVLGNKVRIDGAANVHDWTMDGTLIGGWLELPASVVLDSSQAAAAGVGADGKIPARAEVRIPVTSVKNIHGYEGMDEVMQAAMDAKDYPAILFHLTDMTLKQPHAAGAPLEFDTQGTLSLNGSTNKISFPVTIESVDKTTLKVKAAGIPINMTDYGVKPPVKAVLFVTKPEVKISFEWVIGLASKPAETK